MAATPEDQQQPRRRAPLSRDGIVESALTLVKEQGLAAVSMRRLAKLPDVQPMSLY